MWSIIMEPGKTYSTVVENTFHLSMATLDVASVKKADDIHTVYVETNDGPRVILCHLSKSSKMFQCSLDHVITRGTDIKFVTSATANIHMTGYVDDLEEDDEEQMYSDLESEAEAEEEESQISKKQTADKGNKRKAENSFSKKSKSIKLDEKKSANSDDDEDESDETLDFEDDSDEDGLTVSDMLDDEAESGDEVEDFDEEDDDEDDEDDDDDEDESEESDVEVKPQSTKKTKQQLNGKEQLTPKKEQKTPIKGQEKTPKVQEKTPKGQKTPIPKTPDANKSLINGTTESNKKKNKEPKTPLNESKTKPDTPLPKNKLNQPQKLNGGVMITDLKVGDGAVAKPGKNVKVYYIGRLKSTGKVFDSMQKGPGFTFGLQRGEVIKGWDIGIAGMKVGGKRKVICPPNMAYGAKGSPPEIPPNSTLVFDVELKHQHTDTLCDKCGIYKTLIVDKPLHLTMAALDIDYGAFIRRPLDWTFEYETPQFVLNNRFKFTLKMKTSTNNQEVIICHLHEGNKYQSNIDLYLQSGTSVVFSCQQTCSIHLSGYSLS